MQEIPRKGSDTSERILDVAEAAVLEKGFAATSIEEPPGSVRRQAPDRDNRASAICPIARPSLAA